MNRKELAELVGQVFGPEVTWRRVDEWMSVKRFLDTDAIEMQSTRPGAEGRIVVFPEQMEMLSELLKMVGQRSVPQKS